MEGIARITLPQTPPSLNKLGARGNPRQFHRRKKGWQQLFEGELTFGTASDVLPRRVDRVTVTGRMEFKTRRRRDCVNFQPLIDKALGDALVNGGWLADDTPEHYRFAELDLVGGCEQARTILDLHWEINPDLRPIEDRPVRLGETVYI